MEHAKVLSRMIQRCKLIDLDFNELNNSKPRCIFPFIYAFCVDENLCDGVTSTFLESDYLYRDYLMCDDTGVIDSFMDPRKPLIPCYVSQIRDFKEDLKDEKKRDNVLYEQEMSYDSCRISEMVLNDEMEPIPPTDCHRSRVHYATDKQIYDFWSEINKKISGFDRYIRDLVNQITNQENGVNTVELRKLFELFLLPPDYTRHFNNSFKRCPKASGPHRNNMMVWMTFLKDDMEGGEVVFPGIGCVVRPRKGLTLMWPATLWYDYVLSPSTSHRIIAKGFLQMDQTKFSRNVNL